MSVDHATIGQLTEEGNKMETTTLPTVNAVEIATNGEVKEYTLTGPEVSDMIRRHGFVAAKLNTLQSQVNQIIDNLTEDYWFNPNTDTETILTDLCEILDVEPKKEISFTATFTVTGRYDIPLSESSDFDLEAFLADTMSIDAYNGDVVIDNWELERADEF